MSDKIARHILLSLDTKGINKRFLTDKLLLQDFVETLQELNVDEPKTGKGRTRDRHKVYNYYEYKDNR